MYKIGDTIVYKRDVCIVKDIKKNHLMDKDYYILSPISDSSLTIDVPVDNKLGKIRNVISKKEALDLIDSIPSIELIENMGERYVENEYKSLLYSSSLDGLIKIIKTSYLRNLDRINNMKKISGKDDEYLKKAERLLYNELSISLGMSYEETKEFVSNRCNKTKE